MLPKDLVAASSRPLVLAILARGESYGYALLQEVRRLSGGEIAWTEGMLYPVLHRLEREGLLRGRWRKGPSGRRRKYYALSTRGRRSQVKERERWSTVHETLLRAWKAAAPSI